jgi:hypothetical protein
MLQRGLFYRICQTHDVKDNAIMMNFIPIKPKEITKNSRKNLEKVSISRGYTKKEMWREYAFDPTR